VVEDLTPAEAAGRRALANTLLRAGGDIVGKLASLVLFAVMAWFALRPRAPGSAGRLVGIFLIGYGIARSVAELFREPDAHLGFLLGGLTMGQLLSLPMVLIGILLVVRSHARAPRSRLERP